MKKLLCVALVLLVGVVPMVAVASQEREPVEHLLWDIPFGIGVEECLALMKERTGVELGGVMDWSDVEYEVDYLYSYRSDTGSVTLLDYLTTMYACFDEDETFQMVEVEFPRLDERVQQETLGEVVTMALQEALKIFEKAKGQYGEMTGGYAYVYEVDMAGKEEWYQYSFPITNGMPDEKTLYEILLEKKHKSVSLVVFYGNIIVDAWFNECDRENDEYRLTLDVSLFCVPLSPRLREEAFDFTGKDGGYQKRLN